MDTFITNNINQKKKYHLLINKIIYYQYYFNIYFTSIKIKHFF